MLTPLSFQFNDQTAQKVQYLQINLAHASLTPNSLLPTAPFGVEGRAVRRVYPTHLVAVTLASCAPNVQRKRGTFGHMVQEACSNAASSLLFACEWTSTCELRASHRQLHLARLVDRVQHFTWQ